jgi:hypothetical protein
MPNWCNNGITLRHADPAMIDRVIKGKEGLLMEFLPTPEDLQDAVANFEVNEAMVAKYGYSSWYDWNINNWGTKWDFALENVEREDANTVTAAFDSAWAPPIEAYVKLCALGFEVEAMYYEPGMQFVGKFIGNEDESDDDCIEYGGATADTVRELIGEELDDYFGISEEMAQYEEEDQE